MTTAQQPVRLTPETYPAALDALTECARAFLQLTEDIDVPEMLTIVQRHQALAPIVEPTRYARQGGSQNLADQAAFLRAVADFTTALRKLDRSPTQKTTTP